MNFSLTMASYYFAMDRLAELPGKAAHALAHGNAERLWRLPPAK